MCEGICVIIPKRLGSSLFGLTQYHLPNLWLTLKHLRLCNSNLLLPSEARIATDVAFPVW